MAEWAIPFNVMTVLPKSFHLNVSAAHFKWNILWKNLLVWNWGGGTQTQYKKSYRDVPQIWVAKSASWNINDPLSNAKFGTVYEWVDFSKKVPNLSQNWLKFKEICEKSGNFGQNLAQNYAKLVYEWSFFVGKMVYMVHFQIPSGTSLPTMRPPCM